MLFRDVQEDARILYLARKNSQVGEGDLLLKHLTELSHLIQWAQNAEQKQWKNKSQNPKRLVGLMLLVALELANKMELDSLESIKEVLLDESP